MGIINKDNYEKISEEIKKIVNEVDPVYLIGAGAPSDEYDSEINRIISSLKDMDKVNDVFHVLNKTFGDSFGDTKIDGLKIKAIAEKIEKLLNN